MKSTITLPVALVMLLAMVNASDELDPVIDWDGIKSATTYISNRISKGLEDVTEIAVADTNAETRKIITDGLNAALQKAGKVLRKMANDVQDKALVYDQAQVYNNHLSSISLKAIMLLDDVLDLELSPTRSKEIIEVLTAMDEDIVMKQDHILQSVPYE